MVKKAIMIRKVKDTFMKVERWYDIGCMKCGKHLSTDFNYGMRTTREDALKCAKECGFKDVDGITVCPECISVMKSEE